MWLEFFQRLVRIINKRKPGALAATVLRSKAEGGDLVLIDFVELSELLAQLVFANIGAIGVKNVAISGVPCEIVYARYRNG